MYIGMHHSTLCPCVDEFKKDTLNGRYAALIQKQHECIREIQKRSPREGLRQLRPIWFVSEDKDSHHSVEVNDFSRLSELNLLNEFRYLFSGMAV